MRKIWENIFCPMAKWILIWINILLIFLFYLLLGTNKILFHNGFSVIFLKGLSIINWRYFLVLTILRNFFCISGMFSVKCLCF